MYANRMVGSTVVDLRFIICEWFVNAWMMIIIIYVIIIKKENDLWYHLIRKFLYIPAGGARKSF
jgi:hypothetical protein